MMLNEDELWNAVDSLNWDVDHNYERISKKLQELDQETAYQIYEFVCEKVGELQSRFEDDWLGEPGIGVSDDSWSDLTNEVVGRGREFYEKIDVECLQDMADHNDYYENFSYSFQFLYD